VTASSGDAVSIGSNSERASLCFEHPIGVAASVGDRQYLRLLDQLSRFNLITEKESILRKVVLI
jgi:hypothetical protein